MKKLFVTVACLMSLLCCGHSLEPSEAMETYLKPSYLFAYSIFQNVSASTNSNVALSATALLNSMTMLYEASTGETEKILADVIKFPTNKEQLRDAFKTVQLEVRSAMGPHNFYKEGTRFFVARSINIAPEFTTLLKTFYPTSGVENVDFNKPQATAGRINWWVNQRTNGSIPTIIKSDDINTDTEIAIVSAEYFKGLWKTPFNPTLTRDLPFHVTPDETIEVPLMYAKGMYHVVHVDEGGFTLLKLPYQDSNMSFVILLPDEGKSLAQVENAARDNFFLRRDAFEGDAYQTCEIFLPKFTLEASINLVPIFKKIGRLGDLITRPTHFSSFVNDRLLSLSSITHKARVQVDEFGTTAAAVQATLIGRRMMTNECYFRASRPFLFVIQQDKVPVPLFMGKIVRPAPPSA